MPGSAQFSSKLSAAYEDRDYYFKSICGAGRFYSNQLSPKYTRAVTLAKKNRTVIRRILDIGCGRGELVNYYCSHGVEAIGIEYSKTACEIASELLSKNPCAELATILNIRNNVIDYPEHYFDVAFLLEVVEHLYGSQLDEYYAQLRKLLRPGGVVVIHTWPNRLQRNRLLSWYELSMRRVLALPYRILFQKPIKPTLRSESEELMHVNEHTPDQLFQHLRRHDFQVWVFTSYFGGAVPDSWSDLFGEAVLNFGPLGWVPGIKKYLNRYVWAVAINPG